MDNERAKIILLCHRPGDPASGDPELEEALQLAQRDRELGQWLQNQSGLRVVVRNKLQDIPIPFGLKTRILANRPQTRPVLPSWLDWLRNPVFTGVMAAILAMVGVAIFWLTHFGPATLEAYQVQMVAFVSNEYAIDFESDDLHQVRMLLAQNDYPDDYIVPPGLHTYPLEGGVRHRWRGNKVSMLCFGSHEKKIPDVWVFVLDRNVLPGAQTSTTPQFSLVGNMATATWSNGQIIYFAATEADESTLRKLL
jgi:hypothetical protein